MHVVLAALLGGLLGASLAAMSMGSVGWDTRAPAPHIQVILPQGTTLLNASWLQFPGAMPGALFANFTVLPPGAELTGQLAVSNFSGGPGWLPYGTSLAVHCPALVYHATTVNETLAGRWLAPGPYAFLQVCGGAERLVVTQSVQLTYS